MTLTNKQKNRQENRQKINIKNIAQNNIQNNLQNMFEVGTIISTHGIQGNVVIRSDVSKKCFRKLTIFDEKLLKINISLLHQKGSPQNADLAKISENQSTKNHIKSINNILVGYNIFVCKLDDCTTIEQAKSKIGLKIYSTKDQLPKLSEGEFYKSDLIGLHIIDENNKKLGIVTDVLNFGAGDILYVLIYENNSREMLPFNNNLFPIVTKEYIVAQNINLYI